MRKPAILRSFAVSAAQDDGIFSHALRMTDKKNAAAVEGRRISFFVVKFYGCVEQREKVPPPLYA